VVPYLIQRGGRILPAHLKLLATQRREAQRKGEQPGARYPGTAPHKVGRRIDPYCEARSCGGSAVYITTREFYFLPFCSRGESSRIYVT